MDRNMAPDRQKRYWKGPEDSDISRTGQIASQDEFDGPLPDGTLAGGAGFSRRSFLKAAGFSVAGSMLASCAREPVEKAIPVLVQEENMMPGKAYWYASTCGGCQANCGILTKNRDGRPVKIEGNPQHPITGGGVCAVGQAMVLGLYDSQRLRQPVLNGSSSAWPAVDQEIGRKLSEISGGAYVLTGTITSPSTQAAIDGFLGRYDGSRHVVSDAVSYSAIRDAHSITHGRRTLPRYQFKDAEVIVSVEADFLGTWLSPVEFTRGYTAGRTLQGDDPRLSHHVQFEGRMSLTGSNADRRVPIVPAEASTVLRHLADRVSTLAGRTIPQLEGVSGTTGVNADILDDVAQRLWDARGKGLVLCGVNDTGTQCIVNAINDNLGNYGTTVDLGRPSNQWQSDDGGLEELMEEMRQGRVNALIVHGTNPVYSLKESAEFAELLQSVSLTVSITDYVDETAAVTDYVCPINHPLESWNDAETVPGIVSLSQPAIRPLGQTRSVRECLAAWTGAAPSTDLELVQGYWRQRLFSGRSAQGTFEGFWDKAVHDGFAEITVPDGENPAYQSAAPWPESYSESPVQNQYSLVLYEKIGLRDGRHAYNPWLQELPDPVTKVVWDNYVQVSSATASNLGVSEGDLIRLAGADADIELPVQVQPGQHDQVLAVALGYGRAGTDRFADMGPDWFERRETVASGETVGRNGFVFSPNRASGRVMMASVSAQPAGGHVDLALTQTHHMITVPEHLGGERRNMVRDTTLAAYKDDPSSGNHAEHEVLQLWADDYTYEGHHWGLAIDLNKCTGCSACAISCQAENNVPAVGRDEVYRRREMHWIRIDRYYAEENGQVDVMFQPVMCQHCDNAPCETVCPVLATVHSDEGVNQQIYNRCVGTRYCANNCPYKVRRFNWFDYWPNGTTEHLALNPDISARSRGVMEKCSLCVQRVQESRGEAKRQGRALGDGDILTACQQSCPAEAIVFGDMNDPDSRVSSLISSPRHYRMLEEMNYRPTVGYLTKVRHRDNEDSGHA